MQTHQTCRVFASFIGDCGGRWVSSLRATGHRARMESSDPGHGARTQMQRPPADLAQMAQIDTDADSRTRKPPADLATDGADRHGRRFTDAEAASRFGHRWRRLTRTQKPPADLAQMARIDTDAEAASRFGHRWRRLTRTQIHGHGSRQQIWRRWRGLTRTQITDTEERYGHRFTDTDYGTEAASRFGADGAD